MLCVWSVRLLIFFIRRQRAAWFCLCFAMEGLGFRGGLLCYGGLPGLGGGCNVRMFSSIYSIGQL